MSKIWSFFTRASLRRPSRYDTIISPASNMEDTSLWQIPAPDSEHGRNRRAARGDRQRLQRRASQPRKIKREDLVNVLSRAEPMAMAPDLLEDETIPGKAIVLKMPENSMKTYFIPLPADLDGLKRRAIELFNLAGELDIYSRLEFELFAFGIIPTSRSLSLLRDREVVYVNVLPPRPPTPFSLTLAPPRPENSLVAEVRRPGTGLPFEVVYTQQNLAPPGDERYSFEQGEALVDAENSKPGRKLSRFKEHMSDSGSPVASRHSRSLSVGELDAPRSPGKMRQKSPANKVWYKENATEQDRYSFHGSEQQK